MVTLAGILDLNDLAAPCLIREDHSPLLPVPLSVHVPANHKFVCGSDCTVTEQLPAPANPVIYP